MRCATETPARSEIPDRSAIPPGCSNGRFAVGLTYYYPAGHHAWRIGSTSPSEDHSSSVRTYQAAEKALPKTKILSVCLEFTISRVIFAHFLAAAKPLMRPWADSGQTHPVASSRGRRIKL